MRFRILMLVLTFLHISLPLYSSTKGVSVKECVKIALENHPDIMVSQEKQKKAVANYRIARSRNKLFINAEIKTVERLKEDASSSGTRIPGRDTDLGLFAGPTFAYNLIDPRKSKMEDSARISVDISKMDIIKVRSNIIYSVKKTYYGYLFARESKALRLRLKNKFIIKLKKAKMLFKNGQRPVLDVTKADVDLADATLRYEKAKNYESMMKTELLSSMGILNENIEVSPIEVKELPELRFSLKELYRLAEDNYPEIKISKLKMNMDRMNISVERRAHIPRVDIYGGVGVENTEFITRDKMKDNLKGENWNSSTFLGLKAILSIYSGGGIQAKTDAAIAEYNKSKYVQKKIVVKMRATIRKFLQTMNELEKQIEISKLIIENSKKHLMLAQKSYENGIASHLDIQDAERMVLEAELNHLKARYDYLITLAKLSHVVGLKEEYLCKK